MASTSSSRVALETESQTVIGARLARFQLTMDARDLWPEVSIKAFRAAEGALGDVVARALNESGEVVLSCPPGTDPRALGVAATGAGIGALLGYWLETGRVIAEPALATLFAKHLAHGRRRAVQLRQAFEGILTPLAECGIAVLVLKGMHTAYAYFPDPGTRITSDVDLVVDGARWEQVRAMLADRGFEEATDPRHPEQSSWSLPGARAVRALEFTHADSAWSIDLHRSLERIAFPGLETTLGTLDVATAERWEEFSRPVHRLSQPLLLAYLALHASSHFYAIPQIRLVELALVARRDFGERRERWDAFRALVAHTRTARFVFPALDLAERLVPGTIDRFTLEDLAVSAPRRLRRLVRNTAPANAQRLHPFPGLRERFVWVASPREAAAAARWLLWPTDPGTSWLSALRRQGRRVYGTLRRVLWSAMRSERA